MAWVTKNEPPKEAETIAGVVKIKLAAERPFVEIIKTSTSEMAKTDWERKEKRYDIFLTPVGSNEEREIGHATILYRRVRDIESSKLHDAFTSRGFKDESIVAQINTFYPVAWQEYGHKGIGRAVLKEVLEQCKSEGAVAAYCSTIKPLMQALLGKTGFQKDGLFYLKNL
jgi:GNAT superfamily N-acetyltransferase